MEVEFADDSLERLYYDPKFEMGLATSLVKAYRRIVGYIIAAQDERAIREMKSFHFEKLRGRLSHQRSLRLNRQFRLIIELDDKGVEKVVTIIAVEDYH